MLSHWVQKLESTSSKLEKEAIVSQLYAQAQLGDRTAIRLLTLVCFAYSPFNTFGVREIPMSSDEYCGAENPWDEFILLCQSLALRDITGNSARSVIETMRLRFDTDEWNTVCARVLKKDLRAGISDKTFNKVLKGTAYEIPVFSCQLAQDGSDSLSKLVGKKRLEVKLDGVRVLAFIQITPTSTSATLYSRNGQVFENFIQIEQELVERIAPRWDIFSTTFGNTVVLDGEVVSASFQKLMGQARRKKNANANGSVFHIFDIIPKHDFSAGAYNMRQRDRSKMLTRLVPAEGLASAPHIKSVSGCEVDLSSAEGHDIMARFMRDAIAAGFEGIMIKDFEAPYECTRNSFWLKQKPTISHDMTIVGFEEGSGKHAGRLGAIVCEELIDDKLVRSNVGSGFSDKQRKEIWEFKENLLKHIAEIEADAISQNKDGSYSLRFPRFKRFRGFLPEEKL